MKMIQGRSRPSFDLDTMILIDLAEPSTALLVQNNREG